MARWRFSTPSSLSILFRFILLDLVNVRFYANKFEIKPSKHSVMIQRQQCVACNLMIPASHSTDGSCTCGHVFTERKLIGGKRFSEYRAELYSRLENKKQRGLIRENKLLSDKTRHQQRFESFRSPDATGRPKSPNKEKYLKNSVIQRTKEPFVKPKTIIRRQVNQPHHAIKTKWIEPRETIALQNLMRRFPGALKEINKRLVSQNLLWSTLNNRRHHMVNH